MDLFHDVRVFFCCNILYNAYGHQRVDLISNNEKQPIWECVWDWDSLLLCLAARHPEKSLRLVLLGDGSALTERGGIRESCRRSEELLPVWSLTLWLSDIKSTCLWGLHPQQYPCQCDCEQWVYILMTVRWTTKKFSIIIIIFSLYDKNLPFKRSWLLIYHQWNSEIISEPSWFLLEICYKHSLSP